MPFGLLGWAWRGVVRTVALPAGCMMWPTWALGALGALERSTHHAGALGPVERSTHHPGALEPVERPAQWQADAEVDLSGGHSRRRRQRQ